MAKQLEELQLEKIISTARGTAMVKTRSGIKSAPASVSTSPIRTRSHRNTPKKATSPRKARSSGRKATPNDRKGIGKSASARKATPSGRKTIQKNVSARKAKVVDKVSESEVEDSTLEIVSQEVDDDHEHKLEQDSDQSSCDNDENHEPSTEWDKIIERAFTFGESNSLLLMGPASIWPEINISQPSRVVRLNGILCSSDAIALRNIRDQLSLSESSTATSQDCFSLLISALASKSNEPLIFILEEFHCFALQPKQRLLYALFDEVQSSKNTIVVIGISDRSVRHELIKRTV